MPGEDAEELRDELPARVRAEQVAALEIGEQVGARGGARSAVIAGGHQVGRRCSAG